MRLKVSCDQPNGLMANWSNRYEDREINLLFDKIVSDTRCKNFSNFTVGVNSSHEGNGVLRQGIYLTPGYTFSERW